jgi:hypothetical protein
VSFWAAWVHYDSRSEQQHLGIHLIRLGKPVPTPSAIFLTLNKRRSHEAGHSISKQIAPAQELQTKSPPNQTREDDFCLSADALRSETANQNL